MKHLTFLFFLLAVNCQGQTFKEWFRQKKTQKRYLIEQIAQLKIYLELTEKGYKIAKTGLTAIGNFKNGEFKLHRNHFDTLKIVNPKVTGYFKVKEMFSWHYTITDIKVATMGKLSNQQFLQDGELTYLQAVFDKISLNCNEVMSSLLDVIKDKQFAMSDNERLQRIDLLYHQMQDNYQLTKAFSGEAIVLARSRVKEKNEVNTAKKLHGVN